MLVSMCTRVCAPALQASTMQALHVISPCKAPANSESCGILQSQKSSGNKAAGATHMSHAGVYVWLPSTSGAVKNSEPQISELLTPAIVVASPKSMSCVHTTTA